MELLFFLLRLKVELNRFKQVYVSELVVLMGKDYDMELLLQGE